VIVIAAILAGATTALMTRPMEGYHGLARRAELVDVAESALRRIARDVRRALPNSVRVTGAGAVLEVLHSVDGVRYRRRPGINPGPVLHTAPSDWLSFAASGDAQFNALGGFQALAFTYGTPLPAGTRLAIYTTGTAVYADAASDANPGVITPSTSQVTIVNDTDEDQIQLSAPFQFLFESPRQRLYVVDTPLTYLCDLGTATLTRYWAYPIALAQPTNPTLPPLSAGANALVTNHVTACGFTYQPGTSQRAALLTMEMQVSEDGEQVRLLHQIHVENVP
jgi:MSHA biogenesis protein MshO